MNLNENFEKLEKNYLFSKISRRIAEYRAANPDKKIVRLGIGDVTKPVVPVVRRALVRAARECGNAKRFKGYGDEQGYLFLRSAISKYYLSNGVEVATDEIFVGDGAKTDLGNFLELFKSGINVLIPNPVYPAYVDANVMAGNKIFHYTDFENFDKTIAYDLIYICSPNNPTGKCMQKAEMERWINYASSTGATIIFDGAYSSFVRESGVPKSIFEIDGARICALEINSFSKSAGFTGLRLGYTIIPKTSPLNALWLRRQTTKFNGASYPVQCAGAAALTPKGVRQNAKITDYYLGNARIISRCLGALGIEHTNSASAPYIWLKCPKIAPMTSGDVHKSENVVSSFEFFEFLLNTFQIVGTPGAGFGSGGEGWFRLSAFSSRRDILTAIRRIENHKKSPKNPHI
jgi:LL-diaminopimelate aminotransferase